MLSLEIHISDTKSSGNINHLRAQPWIESPLAGFVKVSGRVVAWEGRRASTAFLSTPLTLGYLEMRTLHCPGWVSPDTEQRMRPEAGTVIDR